MALVKVVVAEAGEYVDDAAQIWAEATAIYAMSRPSGRDR